MFTSVNTSVPILSHGKPLGDKGFGDFWDKIHFFYIFNDKKNYIFIEKIEKYEILSHKYFSAKK